MNRTRILSTSIAMLLATSAFAADTVQNFDAAGTAATSTQSGSAPGPAILGGGPGGNFLRLLNDGVNGQANSYTFDNTNDGNYSTITASYDFRMGGGGGNADGFSFLLIPTSIYGNTGIGAGGFTAEEPNVASVFAIGHDVYQDNAISLHWSGEELSNISPNAGSVIDFANNVFNRATVTLTQVGNSSNVTVSVTKDVFGSPQVLQLIHQAVNVQPYANRAQFTGRTGGLDMNVDLDNINVAYTGTAAALPAPPVTGRLFQNFDSAGATGFVTNTTSGAQNNPGFDAPVLLAAGGSDGGAFLRLAKDSQGSTLSAVSLDRGKDGGVASGQKLEVDFRMSNPDGQPPADGIGIFLLPTAAFGEHGNGTSIAYESPNLANTLGIGMRVYNGNTDHLNHFSINWNGSEVAGVDLSKATFDSVNSLWNRAQIEVTAAAGGSNVTLRVVPDVAGVPGAPITIFSNQFVPGLSSYDYRVMVGARTGGATVTADVDRITSSALTTGSPTTSTTQNFDSVGTGFQSYDDNASTTLHPTIVTGGPTGNFLRLTHADNGQVANVGFEQSVPGGGKESVSAEFDFRMNADNIGGGIQRADGFQLSLLNIGAYGTSGILDTAFHGYEGELLANALSLGFRVYDGDLNSTQDFIRLGFNGAEANFTTFNTFDLNSDQFHHVKLDLVNNGADTLATLTLTPDWLGAPGSPVTVFSNVNIAGLDLDAFDFRAAFGARTGGANTAVDIDNLNVNYVPEPSAALSLAAGGLMLLGRRRKGARGG